MRARAVQQRRQETFAQCRQPPAPLQIVPGLLRAGDARLREIGHSADVVAMEVRQHDPVDRRRVDAVAGQLVAQRLARRQVHRRQQAVQPLGKMRGGGEEVLRIAGVEQQVAVHRVLQQRRQRRELAGRQRRAAARGAFGMGAVPGFVQPPAQRRCAHVLSRPAARCVGDVSAATLWRASRLGTEVPPTRAKAHAPA
jgi:hypothetical protein